MPIRRMQPARCQEICIASISLRSFRHRAARSVGMRPGFVAQASYHVPGDEGSEEIRKAQLSLWTDGIALEGPDSDALRGDLRERQGQGSTLAAKVYGFMERSGPIKSSHGSKAKGKYLRAIERYKGRDPTQVRGIGPTLSSSMLTIGVGETYPVMEANGSKHPTSIVWLGKGSTFNNSWCSIRFVRPVERL